MSVLAMSGFVVYIICLKVLKDRAGYLGCEAFECLDAYQGVAVLIEFRAPDSYREFAGEICYDSATDAAFAGKADAEGKIARLVVETACSHERAEAFGFAFGEYALAVGGINALVGEELERACEIYTVHRYRALMAIDVYERFDIVVYVSEAFHEICESSVAVGMQQFRLCYSSVIVYVVVTA